MEMLRIVARSRGDPGQLQEAKDEPTVPGSVKRAGRGLSSKT
jgi:hypothetical protein